MGRVVSGLVVMLVAVAAAGQPRDADAPAARLMGAALAGGQAYATVQSLADRIGPRPAGSPAAERAVEWAVKAMVAAGLKNVHKEPVTVGRWVRGDGAAELVAPSSLPLHATALGGSVGTPPAGLSAQVLEVASFDELKALGEKVRGRIVLFNKPMVRQRTGEGYGPVAALRGHGAVEAARLGAIAALTRSAGTGAYQLPHTGATRYDDHVVKIPYAAVTAEDADLIHRLLATGAEVRVKLKLGCRWDGTARSSNVVGDVPGSEKPDEVVLLGAHLDSWDLGNGALDDGAGCAIVLEAARLLLALHLQPKRTVRVVLFMNEENGLEGAKAYALAHKDELDKHVAAMEADSGAGRPIGLSVTGGAPSVTMARRLAAPLEPWLSTDVTASDRAGADLIPLQAAAVPALDVRQDMSSYFDWHHTAGDTVDKIDPVELALNVAAMATLAHALADSPDRLPRYTPPPPKW